eukprot:Skav210586  [mRNA]  locus=scaffold3272:127557:127913:- [translate_table: standard]
MLFYIFPVGHAAKHNTLVGLETGHALQCVVNEDTPGFHHLNPIFPLSKRFVHFKVQVALLFAQVISVCQNCMRSILSDSLQHVLQDLQMCQLLLIFFLNVRGNHIYLRTCRTNVRVSS